MSKLYLLAKDSILKNIQKTRLQEELCERANFIAYYDKSLRNTQPNTEFNQFIARKQFTMSSKPMLDKFRQMSHSTLLKLSFTRPFNPTGQYVAHEVTIEQPQITIDSLFPCELDDLKDQRFLLMISDMNNPDLEKGVLVERCHLLLTDLALPFNNQSSVANTVMSYLPPLPVLSNPKQSHQYLISVWLQPENFAIHESTIDIAVKEQRKKALSAAPHARLTESEGELKHNIRERSLLTTSYLKELGCTPSTFGYFTTTYTKYSSEVYQSLGLHEPVFGRIKKENGKSLLATNSGLLSKLATAVDIASQMNAGSSKSKNKELNAATLAKRPLFRLQTADDTASLIAIKDKGLKGFDFAAQHKVPKISVLAKVGMVKNLESDAAHNFKGILSRQAEKSRDRFKYA